MISLVLIGLMASMLVGCSDKTTDVNDKKESGQTNNSQKEENDQVKSNVKDGKYEVEVVKLTEDKIKVNIVAEVVEKKLHDDGIAEAVLDTRSVPDNDNSAETISLTKKIQGKKSARDRSIVRIKVEGGEVVEIVEI
ncbi:hypothetical protein [Bacillus mycoides]|uniref:hypothetical protein n=2 Tax=Bacillus TaxID=1386 RepID=UPI001495F66D|nr:hypothetical protein [Bacillus mycoides]